MNKYHKIFLLLCISLFFITGVSAVDMENIDNNQTIDSSSLEEMELNQNQIILKQDDSEEIIGDSEEITVNDWDDLQYYCSLDDADYTVRLKENTNYYPTDPADSSYQITVNNNIRIIGSEGAYIGDNSTNPREINYAAIKVNDNTGKGITLQNVTFKWIITRYQSDGVFLVMGGNANNTFENCHFSEISTNMGHSSIIHIKRGFALLKNCTFINCTTDFGCLSVYNPNDDSTKLCTGASMEVTDSYFEGNYARTEPGCINNCGVLVVNNSTFYKNSAFWWAGAIHTHGGANTTIYDSDFLDNLAGWNGGALYTYSYLQIYRSNFIGNNCTTNNGGGAIGACRYLHSPYIHIEDSLFKYNENLCWGLDNLSTTGTGRGGAISIMDSGGLEVYNSIFIKNSASMGTAICAINGGLNHGSPDIRIVGNQFINHTRIGDVLDIRLAVGSIAEIRDNYFSNNSIVFSKLKLTADDPSYDGNVTFHIDATLKNPSSYDSDILDSSQYDVYVNGVYMTTVPDRDFILNLGKGNTARVYVVPSISNSKSNEVFAGIAKTFIFVSQNSGNDENNGSTRDTPVRTLTRAIELANVTENIVIMDGTFRETDLTINYNLTIVAENNAAITVSGNGFKITDGDVKFENITFKNCKYDSSSRNRIIKQESNGFLILESCIFENNNYNLHIEASGLFEANNIIVRNNKNGAFISCDSISIKSSTFANNIATYTLYNALLKYTAQTRKFLAQNLTFIGNTVNGGCINVKKGSGTVMECSFIGNAINSGGKASAIYLEDSSSLLIQSSKFINNTDTGKYSSVIYLSSGSLVVSDSIFINNHYENVNNAVINAVGDQQLQKIVANNNWWGNTPDDLTHPPLKTFSSSSQSPDGWDPTKYYLVLNVTTINCEIELNKQLPVQFIFTQIDDVGNVSFYDGYDIPEFDLTLTAVNGTCSDDRITVKNGMATTYFTLTQKSNASLTGTFNGIDVTIHFEFIRSVPEMLIETNDIYVGDNETVTVDFPANVTGDVILEIDGITQVQTISNSKATFIIPNLPAGNYTIYINYTGDDKYDSTVSNSTFTVNKYDSVTTLSVGAIELGQDVIFTISVSDGATGSVDVYVNGIKQSVNVGENYIIRNIARGDYLIKAVYPGDEYYWGSEDEYKFEVGKIIPALTIDVLDIVYGEDTVVNITMDSNVTGIITVNIDGKTASGELVGGKASVIIPNVNVGNYKLVDVFYSGDNNYKNGSFNSTYNVSKADIDFSISSNNINLGMDAIVEIRLPARVGGTITLNGIKNEVKNVPSSGVITLTYSDLGIGTYTVLAQYNGNNYNTISKSTTFTVSEWNTPQWANDGGNVHHTGKSSYDSDANGEIKWISQVGEITGNLAIDSEGNIYVTTADKIYSFSQNGVLRWEFNSNSAGSGYSGISISRDVVISPNTDDTLYFINQTSGGRYGHANLYQGSSLFSPVVDSKGNVYISGQGGSGNNPNLVIIPYKIWENGGNPIVIALGSTPIASPTIIDDTMVCVPCEGGLKIVDVSTRQVISSISSIISRGTAIVGDGNIIYSFAYNSIVALTSSGEPIWTQEVTGGVGDKLFLDSEQGLYSVNTMGELYRYDLLDGTESKFTDLKVTSGLLIGSDNNVYFASNESFYALDCDGNILWKAVVGNNIVGTPIMDENGIIYANSLNNVYAIKHEDLKDVNLTVNAQSINVGCDEVIIINLNENATGMVNININGALSQEYVSNGKIVKTISDLTIGDYTVTVDYSGDLRYSQSSKSTTFKVLKINPDMVVDVKNIHLGENAVFNVILPDNATGIVTVTVNGKTNSCEVKDGVATIFISGLVKGDYEYTVIYSGDGIYNSSSKSNIISVEKIEFTFDVQVNETVYAGLPVEFIVTNLPSQSSGKVRVEVGDLSNFTISNNGQAKVILNGLKANSYAATVRYYDDEHYMANPKTVSFNVIKRDISFDAAVSDIFVYENATFIISGLPEDATGNIIVKVGGISKSNPVTNGETIIIIEGLSSGAKQATVTFADDEKYNSMALIKEFNVNKMDPSFTVVNILNAFVSENVEFKAYLNPDAYGNISVIENGNALNEIEFSNGEANIIVGGFSHGNKTVIVAYSGNYKYLAKNITKTFFVDKIKSNMIVNAPSRIEEGYDITFDIGLPSDATGKVNVTVGNVFEVIDLKSSHKVTISGLTEGSKIAHITYSGDSKYYSLYLTKEFNVVDHLMVRKLPDINVTVENITVGDSARLIIDLNSDASGSVEVNVDGIYNSSTIINGHASVILNNLKYGIKNARIYYSGDDNYNDTVIFKNFAVNKIAPQIDVSCNNICIGDSAVFEISLNPDASGTVIVRVDGKSNSGILTGGKINITVGGLSDGIKTAFVNYMGDEKYLPGNISCNISVDKLNSPVYVNIEDIDYGSIAVANVILPDGAKGIVKLIIGDYTVNRTVVTSNIPFSIPDLNAGIHTVNIIYSGDNVYKENSTSFSFNVNKVKPDIDLNVEEDIVYGKLYSINVFISNAEGNVSIFVDTTELCHVFMKETLTYDFSDWPVGKHMIKVIYYGDNNHVEGSVNKTITVKKIISGENRNVSVNIPKGTTSPEFTIELSSDATGNLTVYVDGIPYVKELFNGAATIKVENLNVGSHVLFAEYSGDEVYCGFKTDNYTFNVPKVSIPDENNAIKMTSAANSAIPTFTINLPGDAVGELTVTVDGKKTYSQDLQKGSATVKVPELAPGKHTLIVSYTGDAKYSGFSKTVTVNVAKIATKITAKNVKFKAKTKVKKYTITLKAKNKPVKKVQVTIKVKGKTYKAKTNANGKATFKINKLTKKGKHTAVIKFKGDKTYKATTKKVKITVK